MLSLYCVSIVGNSGLKHLICWGTHSLCYLFPTLFPSLFFISTIYPDHNFYTSDKVKASNLGAVFNFWFTFRFLAQTKTQQNFTRPEVKLRQLYLIPYRQKVCVSDSSFENQQKESTPRTEFTVPKWKMPIWHRVVIQYIMIFNRHNVVGGGCLSVQHFWAVLFSKNKIYPVWKATDGCCILRVLFLGKYAVPLDVPEKRSLRCAFFF